MKTADIADVFNDDVQLCALTFLRLGLRAAFSGQIQTVKCFEDNGLLKKELDKPGHGKVLVVDGGSSRRVALMGDQMAALLQQNGWEGIIIDGSVRDSVEINSMDVGVFCLALSPKPPVRIGEGSTNIPISFGGVTFKPGSYVYADPDGVLVSDIERNVG